MTDSHTPKKIVIGVDGSTSSAEALRWAARQAQLSGAELHAVTSWVRPMASDWVPIAVDYDWADNAGSILQRALEALDTIDAAGVHRHVIEGHAARVLLDVAADADLLVVGSRGHGGFSGMLLGSVSQHVIAHASCPVVVVRPDTTGRQSSP